MRFELSKPGDLTTGRLDYGKVTRDGKIIFEGYVAAVRDQNQQNPPQIVLDEGTFTDENGEKFIGKFSQMYPKDKTMNYSLV
jgi:hypothetical protein